MDGYSWEVLEAFVRKEAAVSSKREITKDTTVSGDLGQTGDDADIFMERFFQHFGIDRGDYDFNCYFLMEGEGLLYHFLRKYILRKPHTFEREELTVGMLDKALALGRWDSAMIRK
ncbi:DUF1493 family protein [Burkholderia stagnalis]|uniref:DUF1493 family protein n=1 Tax=Burkholderia stagnalis TaxID=1503054 RepID=UPI000F5652C5|nr:DUF1493 family protein [Burkholderia stagnalis]RQQ28092.1 DUF1493 family protein [Burkholderia stagnalis]RQQ32940.1 DUF1493 family protein [Burkholderia stagnalis]RQQ48887.1 DUF1493 family protein [Burkholderia stagnalis]RQX97485.1 DUF1493 family protein [Burkholderia stagnalis]RQY16698.1 DUF1493 family protein [Burkholderia stagnalis]